MDLLNEVKTVNLKQKVTEYRPTTAEKKLLDVLLNPEHRLKNVTEICELAGCERVTYYRAFKKPHFAEFYRQLTLDLVKGHVGQIVNTFVKCANDGSFQHGKVLLEMAEIYTEKQQHELTGDIHVNFGIPRPPKDQLFPAQDDKEEDDD